MIKKMATGLPGLVGKRTSMMRFGKGTAPMVAIRTAALAGVAAITGCGGGDSPSNSGPVTVVPGTPTPTPTPVSSPTPAPSSPTAEQIEFQRSNAAVAANADVAYRAGATGRGIRIAVIDTGITPGLREFNGRIDPLSTDLGGNRGLADQNGHGTWMSSVALAARDGQGIHGMAFDATLVSFNVSRPADCTPQRCPTSSALITSAIDAAVAAGVRVINMSFSTDQIDENLLAAVRRAAAASIVMVIAAGNETASEPLLLSRAVAEAGAGLVIIAGAHDVTGRPYASGNRAGSGSAATRYLTALGVDVAMTGRDGSIVTFSGTSPATAAISGAAALIAQARPNLTGAQIVSLLLDHASDAGALGRDAVYGNGILNLATSFAALP